MARSVTVRALVIAAIRKGEPIACISRRFGINERTIHRWKNSDIYMIPRAPRNKRGRRRKISSAIEDELMTWVKVRNESWESCTGDDIIAYVQHRFGLQLSRNYVSFLMRRNGYHSRRTQKRPAQRADPMYGQIVEDFRTENSHWTGFSRVFVMDETGLWNDSVQPRSYAPTNGPNPSIKTLPSSSRDTAVATLCADGSKLPLWYIRHQRQRTRNHQVIHPAIKGMNEALMLRYIDEVCVPHMAQGSILYMDNLSSHKTARVRARFLELGIIVRYFPAKTAPDLSPCDNFFFFLMKNNFRRLDRSTPELKIAAAHQAYNAVRAESVRSCWRKCGLIVQNNVDVYDEYESDDEFVSEDEEYDSEF